MPTRRILSATKTPGRAMTVEITRCDNAAATALAPI
jgi:hypothetical protein